jgi:hypothetical protein
MTGMDVGPGVALVALGVTHGLNPGMGWLFAVALGLQERSRRAVWLALPPLAAGHAAAIALAVAGAALMGRMMPLASLKWVIAVTLLALGSYRLYRHRHPRFGGMRVGTRDLAVWSFLMATAHGAGLMALPLVVRAAEPHGSHAHHMLLAGVAGMEAPALWGTLLHSGGYLAATLLAAVLVYERLGIGAVKRLWVNVDLVWAAALVVTALLTPLA